MEKIIKNIKLNRRDRRKIYLTVLILIIICFRIIYVYYIFNFKFINDKTNLKEVMVIELKSIDDNKIVYEVIYDKRRFLLNIYQKNKEDKEKGKNEDLRVYNYGDIIKINGKIKIPYLLNNPNEFDYKMYLNSKNIVGYINTYTIVNTNKNSANVVIKFIYEFKNILEKRIKDILPDKEANLFKSMIYGDLVNLDKELQDKLSEIGLSHIIAVSGSNISFLLIVISNFFSSKNNKRVFILQIIFIIFFCFFSSFSISIIRASIMSIVSIISKMFNIKIKKFTSIAISIIILLIYNPFCIFNISFLFSYLAVIGIMIYQLEIYSFLDVVLKKALKYKYIEKSKTKKYIYAVLKSVNTILSVYIAVQILVLPLQIYYFSKISLVSILSNVIIYPLLNAICFIGFYILFLSFIPFVSIILLNCEYILLNLVIQIADLISNISLNIVLPKPSLLILLIYYLVLVLFRLRKKAVLIVVKSKVNKLRKAVDLLFICYIIYVFVFYINILYFESYIYFFNVEQGNMAFIRYKRKNILIDYGSTTKNLASNILSNFCKEKGIKKIDLCILTHMHEDHVSGVFNDIKEIRIDRILYSYPKEDIDYFRELKELANNQKISMLETDIFDSYQFDDLEIIVLSPSNNEKIMSKDIQNANSQVILISIDDFNLLFMGDATIETEKSIIEKIKNIKDNDLKSKIESKLQKLQIIQIGHHGSKTSTSKEFLSYINVKYAIISSKKEKFGHPHEETLEKLKQYNILFYITEYNGAIKFLI